MDSAEWSKCSPVQNIEDYSSTPDKAFSCIHMGESFQDYSCIQDFEADFPGLLITQTYIFPQSNGG